MPTGRIDTALCKRKRGSSFKSEWAYSIRIRALLRISTSSKQIRDGVLKAVQRAYLKNGGTLGKAACQHGQAWSTRPTPLYNRRSNEVALDEVESVRI
jgi:hypothetical protein